MPRSASSSEALTLRVLDLVALNHRPPTAGPNEPAAGRFAVTITVSANGAMVSTRSSVAVLAGGDGHGKRLAAEAHKEQGRNDRIHQHPAPRSR